MEEEQVILVNEEDVPQGTMGKLEAHQKGILHRAFSIYLLNDKNELLLQRRALHKYHSAGLWTNTCCGHPRPNELTEEAALRRLHEEMCIQTSINESFKFNYKVAFENGLTEHEYLHVFVGKFLGDPKPNKSEAMDWKWQKIERVFEDLDTMPTQFTEWFKLTLPILVSLYNF